MSNNRKKDLEFAIKYYQFLQGMEEEERWVQEKIDIFRYANKQRFFPLKLNKWFGVLQEYSIINNILLYDIRIGRVDCNILL
jgi:hypothetical protein